MGKLIMADGNHRLQAAIKAEKPLGVHIIIGPTTAMTPVTAERLMVNASGPIPYGGAAATTSALVGTSLRPSLRGPSRVEDVVGRKLDSRGARPLSACAFRHLRDERQAHH
jgi:hypothetical protein